MGSHVGVEFCRKRQAGAGEAEREASRSILPHSPPTFHQRMFKTLSNGASREMPSLTNYPFFSGGNPIAKLVTMTTPNQLSRKAIEDFKAIYADEFGEVLSDAQVQEMAKRLLRLFGMVLPTSEHDERDHGAVR
jgi:hypothetical protein